MAKKINKVSAIPKHESKISEENNSSNSEAPSKTTNPEQQTKITINNLITAVFSGYGEKANEQTKSDCNSIISKYLLQVANEYVCSLNYNIICLYDDGNIVKSDADKIYNSVTKFTDKKPLLLILYSRGGSAGSAYLIGKLCREYANGKLVITVPRMAKSAATLVCCAANEIHMGSLSELGPIDPQINDLPALGLKNSVDHIAELVKKYPSASDMFAKYLNLSMELINLGYYERVAESAMQYAEKLLLTHTDNLPRPAKEIAYELVYKYKDHGFVIDKLEALEIFGDKIIKMNTQEYELGNTLYRTFDLLVTISALVNHSFYFIGSLDSSGIFTKRQAKQ